MNGYIVSAFGRTTLVTAFGDLGKMTIYNGGISFSNPTASAYAGEPVIVAKGSAGGSESNTLQTINPTASIVSNTTAAISTTLTSTNLGSDISYALSNSKILITGVKYLKPVGYGASVVSIGTDIMLSIDGQQSWTETSINTVVTVIAIGVGGWPGVFIQLDYIGAKGYMQTVNEHPEWILPATYHSFTH